MSKKTFYTILITLAGLLIIGGLVWYFFSKPSTPSAPATTESAGFSFPGQETAADLLLISVESVISARFVGNDILFYDFSDQLWQLKSGELNPSLSAQQVAENPKPGAKSTAFSPDAKKIVYYISDSKNNSLFTSDIDGRNQKTLIKNLQLRDIILSWPKTNEIIMTSRPSGLVRGGLWWFDTNNSKLVKVIGDLPGLEAVFSPKGDEFIYSYVSQNGQNPILAVYRTGISKKITNVSTLVDKCAWSDDSVNIYCAIPKSWPDSAVLPDDYYKGIISTIDDIWKINTETGAKNIVFEDMEDISNLALNDTEDSLIFILKSSGFLYRLNLK